ncbi:MAG: hypothetical protein DBW94_04355 [Gammaproteobacteria bacterium]|nr:MAG: hypothetical protein DBW94_04355 [Gammaproteobacteria bacterium]
MPKNYLFAFVVTLSITIVPLSSFSHHGWSYYKENVEKIVTIVDLKLRNPHDQLLVEDEDGKEWNLLLAPPSRNRRFGFDGSNIEVGDEIGIIGQKHTSKYEIKVHCIFKENEKIYTYRYPNGRTSYEFMRNKPNC